MKLRGLLSHFLLFIVLGVTVTASLAQELCEALVREAWEVVTENCGDTDGQRACYGHDSLEVTFTAADVATEFVNPSDQADLVSIQTVRTLPFDEEEEEWGIGDFTIPAEPFGGSADDFIRIFTTGDVVVENAAYAVEGSLPMQTFNFTTAGRSDCREAPNAVFIQSPDGLTVDLNVNSTPIRLGSTVVLGTDVDDATGHDLMWFGVVEGAMTINPDTPEAQTMPEGTYTTTLLSDEQGQGLDDSTAIVRGRVPVLDPVTGRRVLGPRGVPFYRQVPVVDFAEPEEITVDGESFAGWGAYQYIETIPVELLSYTVEIPDSDVETVALAPTVVLTPVETNNWCYAGGPWGDGRCNDPDPNIRAWYWHAGWYRSALERGVIDEIPPEYGGGLGNGCYIEVGQNAFQFASETVRNGGNEGDFVWASPLVLNNVYSGWLIWDDFIWSVGYYGDCSPLGVGPDAPPGLNVVPPNNP